MGILGALLRIARSIVMNVVKIVTQQVNLVQDAITRPVQAIVQQVLAGAWKGDGAQRFAEEMSNMIIPQLGNLTMSFTNTGNYITRALDTMYRADKQASKIAGGLLDVFKGIFN